MALLIFPSSPLPGGLRRKKDWNGNYARYDSGAGQGFTAWTQPRFEWGVPWKNINEIKQGVLSTFVDSVRGMVDPFLIKDAYDYQVGSVQFVNSNQTQGSTLQTFDVRSFHIRVDTTFIGSLTSAVSGFVTLGSEYDYDQDNGIITVNTFTALDIWSNPSTIEFFRKVHFKNEYSDTSPIWNQFQVALVIEELV